MTSLQVECAKINLPLLVVEDSDEDFEAFCRGWRKLTVANPIYRCTNGDEALDFLYHTGKYTSSHPLLRPGLIILDLNLPGTDGREVLTQIKQDKNLRSIPVVVFTTSSNPKDLEICYQQGVNSYIIKPIDVKKLMKIINILVEYWLQVNSLPYPLYNNNNESQI
ncbi:response regulator [Brunnivagina elsteri]|uniref:Two-component system response regulator n=1 Tax=Brunnivagina elsteri CCALA 953 TaxID=987040 RepID=A0A2A2TLN5_9CYAN|nr:response regulator [Calothrix elsteri]PAX58410.1 two-component system response regulator [Calothrix elsteri CCALA 953]